MGAGISRRLDSLSIFLYWPLVDSKNQRWGERCVSGYLESLADFS